MQANDNRQGPAFEDRKAFLLAMVLDLQPGADGRAGRGAIIRELEQLQPGLIDQHHARQTASRLHLDLASVTDADLPNLSFLDYADAQ